MQNIFDEVGSLDQRCIDNFHLNEDILMEHAADAMADFITQNFATPTGRVARKDVLICCGSGNNGADGIALARLLQQDFDVKLFLLNPPTSPMAKLQYARIQSLNAQFPHAICIIDTICKADIIVDALYGSGLNRALDAKTGYCVSSLNALAGIKIACDIPTGLHASGKCEPNSFRADFTLTMGALKKALFSDCAKDRVGSIKVVNLGVARSAYEKPSHTKLLDFEDMKLPTREIQNSHKGSFGHLGVVSGEKLGASVLCGSAALRFGAALVTLLSNENLLLPTELMLAHQIPTNSTAIALGMGLGVEFSQNELSNFLHNNLPLLLDADIFYHPLIEQLLQRENIVLTPHPKEFTQLLHVSHLAEISVETLQQNRFYYAELFAHKYPNTVLVLKGANVIIAQDAQLFVNPHGTNVLAKGGSGDVLAGLIASLLAQGYTPLEAAISGSLAHTKLARNFEGANFSLTPNDLINGIKNL